MTYSNTELSCPGGEPSDGEVEVVTETVVINSRSPSPVPMPDVTLTMHHESLPPSPNTDCDMTPRQEQPTAPEDDDIIEVELSAEEQAELLRPEED